MKPIPYKKEETWSIELKNDDTGEILMSQLKAIEYLFCMPKMPME